MRTAQSSVKMTIISKSYPVFDHQVYKASVAENSLKGTSVMSLEATSPTGQKLIYSIIEGDRYGDFSVDFNIGEYFTFIKNNLKKLLLMFCFVM